MFGISWGEMAVISVIALVVIGPKDLPRILRAIGHWTGKAQKLANEFRRSLDQMAKDSGVDEVRKTMQTASSFTPAGQVKKVIGAAISGTNPTAPTATTVAKKTNGQAEPQEAAATTAPAETTTGA
ncbi:MAG: twin-arginine translocase subunit TatB [Alphaproteobacteria bacterium]|nr:twin-arginine translocase subunit TatB [Alphaproteobacteria bacterium]